MTLAALPIDSVVPQVADELRRGVAVALAAPAGSGKTTRVPVALVDDCDGAVVVLEPRRIAARAAACRVAAERGWQCGAHVGYEVRDDRRVGPKTRLRYVTEGVLVQRLLTDPFLEGVDVVVLDEFHERHVETDLAIAMLREVRNTVRPDLRIVVMSATLDAEPVRQFLDPCVVVTADSGLHAVRIELADRVEQRPLVDRVRTFVLRALDETPGDVLVFLPGMAEIRRLERGLADLGSRRQLCVLPLHGSLDLAEQDRVLRPSPQRKVVLATNVAESSLTLEGVTAVVDSGLARVLRHDRSRGLDVLRTERISRASATQRAGRAGRTGPGVCYRMWSRAEDRGLVDHDTAEVRRVDLTGPALTIRAFAGRAPAEFEWFEVPERAALDRADLLLRRLALLDPTGRVTDEGRAAVRLPLHPRLGRMLLEARRRRCAGAAAELAAYLSDRDRDWPAVRRDLGVSRPPRPIVRLRDRMLRSLNAGFGGLDAAAIGCALLAGFPDRVMCLRDRRHGQLVGGRGVSFDDDELADVELAVALRIDDSGADRSRVRFAWPIERAWLGEVYADALWVERAAEFDAADRVVSVVRTRFLDLTLDAHRGGPADPAAVEALLAAELCRDPFVHLGDQRGLRSFLARVAWLRKLAPELALPILGPIEVGAAAAQLAPGKRRLRDFRDAPVRALLEQSLSVEQRHRLRIDAPEQLALPSGRSLRIDYEPEPHVAARLQEFFGLRESPTLAGGRVRLTLHLLAPNRRPVQITDDLASFWGTVYPRVRTEMRNRYPKHAWPEDPGTAPPDCPGRRSK